METWKGISLTGYICTGMWKYASFKSMEVTFSSVWCEVLVFSGVSIMKVSDFRYLFSKLSSRIGLPMMLGFGTKKDLLKKTRNV